MQNLAVETLKLFFFERINFSIKHFEAPMIFTRGSALSLETLEKYLGGFRLHKFKSLIAPKTLFFIKASIGILSFSDLTCLWVKTFATTCQISELKILSKVSLNKLIR